MSININTSHTRLFEQGRRTSQSAGSHKNTNSRTQANWQDAARGSGSGMSGTDVRTLKRMLSSNQQQTQDGSQNNTFSNNSTNNIFAQSQSYAESIRAARTKNKNTSVQLKKLRYNFKAISTQIMRSKTSVSARQVAGKARREVIRLKRQRQNGQYDEEELQSAITHAQAMERIAKKKVRHLLEEEMAKVGGPCEGETEEEDLESRLEDEVAENVRTQLEAGDYASDVDVSEALQAQMQAYREMAEAQQREMLASMDDMMSEMADGMDEAMRDLLEESGLDDLAEDMMAVSSRDMDPADYKMMKLKHRSKELQEIAKADAEYLRAVFDKMERDKNAAVQGIGGSGGGSAVSVGAVSGGVAQSGGGVSVKEAIAQVMGGSPAASSVSSSVSAVGAGIDISL